MSWRCSLQSLGAELHRPQQALRLLYWWPWHCTLHHHEVHSQFARRSTVELVHAGPASPPGLSLPKLRSIPQSARQSPVALVHARPATPRRQPLPRNEVHAQIARRSTVELVHAGPASPPRLSPARRLPPRSKQLWFPASPFSLIQQSSKILICLTIKFKLSRHLTHSVARSWLFVHPACYGSTQKTWSSVTSCQPSHTRRWNSIVRILSHTISTVLQLLGT